jgi:hypothetical protein
MNAVEVPNVAALPTTQYTPSLEPGLISETLELDAVVSVLPIRTMMSSLLNSPCLKSLYDSEV